MADAFSDLQHLQTLLLNRNQITEISVGALGGLSHLENLEISENAIGSIESRAFVDLIRLKELVLRSNRVVVLRDWTWEGLGSLDKLDLAHNELRIIRKGLWRGLDHVTELDLSSNHVEVIQAGGFENMLLGEQFSLNLTDNQLTSIHEASFHPGSVHFKNLVLDLSVNPFKCDAEMCWLRMGQAEGWIQFPEEPSEPECRNYPGVSWNSVPIKC